MKYTVYVIRGKADFLYKGVTTDLEKRLKYHNSGWGGWTKQRGPFQIVHKKEFDNKSEALKYEKFLKSGKGREFLKGALDLSGISVV